MFAPPGFIERLCLGQHEEKATSLIIPVNQQFQIKSDRYQWIIQRKRTRKGNEVWESQTYHPSVDAAVRSLGDRMVRECKTYTLVDALKAVEIIATTLSQALRPYFEHGLELKAGPPIVTLKKGVEKGLPNV